MKIPNRKREKRTSERNKAVPDERARNGKEEKTATF